MSNDARRAAVVTLVIIVAMALVGVDAARSFTHGELLRAGLEFVGVLFGGALLGVRLRA